MRTGFQRRQLYKTQYSPTVNPLQCDTLKYDFMSFCHSPKNIHVICQLSNACKNQTATSKMAWGIHHLKDNTRVVSISTWMSHVNKHGVGINEFPLHPPLNLYAN